MSEKVRDITKLRKKKKQTNIFRVVMTILICTLIGCGVYLTKEHWRPVIDSVAARIDRITHGNEEDGQPAEDNFPIKITNGTDYQNAILDNYFVLMSDTHLYLYTVDGRLSDDRQYGYKNPVLKTADKKILIYESGGNKFRVDNKYKMLYENQTEGDIIFARISDEGYVATVTTSDSHVCVLTVYDDTGKQIYYRGSVDRIIEVAFNKGSTACSAVTVYANDGSIVSKAHTFDFTSTQEKWVTTDLDTLCLSADFMDDGSIFVFGEEKCAYYDNTGLRLGGYAYKDKLIDGTFRDGKVAMIFQNEERRKTSLVLINGAEATPMEINIDKELKYIYSEKDVVFFMTDKSIQAYDYNGNLIKEVAISDTYYEFHRIGNYMFLRGYDKIDRITFRL